MTEPAISKSWLGQWRDSLEGLKPQPQVIGYWLAKQANEDGIVDAVDWELLSASTQIGISTLRRELKKGADLIDSGIVIRKARQFGNSFGPTRYVLNLNRLKS